MNNNAIILLSGGLDSVVSLACIRNNFDSVLAIIFNYGQQAFEQELTASLEIAKYYKAEHYVFNIDWLKNFYHSSFSEEKLKIEDLDNPEITKNSAKNVWIPNRNALFINLAACIAEAKNYSHIILGANKEEAKTFKDNSKDFLNAINLSLKNSTQNEVQVIAPLIDMDKDTIVKKGIELNVPFKKIYSCYDNQMKHCGVCESCLRLKRALQLNDRLDLIAELFEE